MPAFEDLGGDRATKMLRLGIVGPRRGVDDLIDRLRTPDGWSWWEACMGELGEGSAKDAATRLVKGESTLDFLAKAKTRHKAKLGAEVRGGSALDQARIHPGLPRQSQDQAQGQARRGSPG